VKERSSSLACETVVPKIKACREFFHWGRNSFFIFSRIYKHFSRLFMKLILLVFLWRFPVAEHYWFLRRRGLFYFVNIMSAQKANCRNVAGLMRVYGIKPFLSYKVGAVAD
jgi:hypothetical protein